jgi:hypothetical protein
MSRQIGILILYLQIAKRMSEEPFEIRFGALLWTRDPSHQVSTRRSSRVLPGMAGVEQGLSFPEVGG